MSLKIENLKLPDIEPFDFELTENGLYGVIGRNGIGKSTLFSVLSGEIAISQGKITTGRVAYLPDVESFDENMSTQDYFQLLAEDERKKAVELAQFFGADKFLKKRIGKYSFGMKQLAATILSFSVQCDLLIIDELFSGLDVAVKTKVYEELKRIKKQRIVILTSHQLREVEYFCDKTYILTEKGLHLVTNFTESAREIGYMEGFY